MRFMEIANPQDQLALWRLISDNVWGAFAQQQPQPQASTAPDGHPKSPTCGHLKLPHPERGVTMG